MTLRLPLSALALTLACTGLAACGSDASSSDPPGEPVDPVVNPGEVDGAWFATRTLSLRGNLPVPAASARFDASHLKTQLSSYDPGSLLRCDVHDDSAYATVVEGLGGVQWGYPVRKLPDLEAPIFQAGIPKPYFGAEFGGATTAAGAADGNAIAVEIAESDIVGVSSDAALFFSELHGLMLVDLADGTPTFRCAAKLPGNVDRFYFHKGHLIAMVSVGRGTSTHSSLLHFRVEGSKLEFVEEVKLGNVSILDSRRFNDSLVLYSDFQLLEADQEAPAPPTPVIDNGKPPEKPSNNGSGTGGPGFSGGAAGAIAPDYFEPVAQANHRMLRVFTIGETLEQVLAESHLDDTDPEGYLESREYEQDTPIGTVVSERSRFGRAMWASDRYFVTTEEVTETRLTGWRTNNYSVCVESKSTPYKYTSCSTQYETRPNPNYKPADNSGGDRACQGTTLSSCLRRVTREAARTIQVPVGRSCETVETTRWSCIRREPRSHTYPTFDRELQTRLYIYEYTADGFVRLDGKVLSVETPDLDQVSLDDAVTTLKTSAEAQDLVINGTVQRLQFQNGFMYAIAEGQLRTYSLAEGSMIHTSTVPVVNDRLESTLFTDSKLYLSDGDYRRGQDVSTLRVLDLSNGAFPDKVSEDRELPGGHDEIRAVSRGIFTTGMIRRFEGTSVNAIKLGLFVDPVTTETSYLILGTDLFNKNTPNPDAQFFDASAERLFMPYSGSPEDRSEASAFGPTSQVHRVGVSRIEGDSIVSEGAVELPEGAQRMRPVPTADKLVMSFAPSSLSTLAPEGDSWSRTPILDYFTPFAVYRLTDDDLYAEISRLGGQCRISVSPASAINERKQISEPFACTGNPSAYGRELIFAGGQGVAIHEDGTISELPATRVATIRAAIGNRDVCLFSEDLIDDTRVDVTDPPDLSTLRCYSSTGYRALVERLHAAEQARQEEE